MPPFHKEYLEKAMNSTYSCAADATEDKFLNQSKEEEEEEEKSFEEEYQ